MFILFTKDTLSKDNMSNFFYFLSFGPADGQSSDPLLE